MNQHIKFTVKFDKNAICQKSQIAFFNVIFYLALTSVLMISTPTTVSNIQALIL